MRSHFTRRLHWKPINASQNNSFSTLGCKDKDGNIYEVYKTWEPNPLITCKCMPGLQVSCRKTRNGCWTGEGKAYMNGQIWLKNSLSMCICTNQNISCTNLSQPACTDENGVVKEHGSNWFAGACFNCTCILGVVKCDKYHVSIQYGLLKIKALGTCVPCHRPWQDIRPSDNGTVSNCKGSFIKPTVNAKIIPRFFYFAIWVTLAIYLHLLCIN